MKLSSKASVLLAVLVVTLIVATAFLVSLAYDHHIHDCIRDDLVQKTDFVAQKTGETLQASLRDAGVIAANLPVAALLTKNYPPVEAYLQKMWDFYPIFENGMFILDAKGTLVTDFPMHPETRGGVFSFREYYQSTLRENKGVIGEPYISARTGKPVITFTAPIRDEQGKIVAVLGCSMDLLSLHGLGNIRNIKVGKTGHVSIMDNTRRILLHPDDKRIFTVPPVGGNLFIDAILDGSTRMFGEGKNSLGVPMAIAAKWIPEVPWLAITFITQEEVYQPMHNMRNGTMLIAFFALCLVTPLGLLAMKRITTPLEILVDFGTKLRAKLSSGDVRIKSLCSGSFRNLRPSILARNEIGVLAICFLKLAARLKRSFSSLHKAKEAAEHANQSKSLFLANMSHDIRTPLSGIMGILQALQESPLNKEQLEYLHLAQQSAGSLLSILSDILDLSKVEAGRLELVQKPFHLETVLAAISAVFKRRADQKGLTLTYRCDTDVPPVVLGDASRLRQVLFNLVSNAVKYTKAGTVTLEVSLNEHPGQVRFRVSDTGSGIAGKDLETVFEPFSQFGNAAQSSRQGTGLGLSIVKRLITLMGGDIAVESVLGQGTTMTFSVPLQPVASEPSLQHTPASPAIPPGKVLLLVEDDRTNQIAMKRLLEKRHFHVLCANNGQEALAMVEDNAIDAILIDINMPVMGGEEATRLLRNPDRFGEKSSLPIIALTADAMDGDRERFLACGMDDYLAKPIEIEELVKILARFL